MTVKNKDLSPLMGLVAEGKAPWSEEIADSVAHEIARTDDTVGREEDDRWIYVIGPNHEETAMVFSEAPLKIASSRMITDECPPAVVLKTDDLLRHEYRVRADVLAQALDKRAVESLRFEVPSESSLINEESNEHGELSGPGYVRLTSCSAARPESLSLVRLRRSAFVGGSVAWTYKRPFLQKNHSCTIRLRVQNDGSVE